MKFKALFLGLAAIALTIFAVGCSSTESSENAPLTNTVWIPTNFDGQENATLDRENAAWLFIADNNRVNGRGGVNGFFGGVTYGDDNEIKFSQMGATLMAGPNLPYETKFLKMLGEVRSYEIKGQILMFRNQDNKVIATFNVGPESLKPVK